MSKIKVTKNQKEKVEEFFEYLQDKIEDCYSNETNQAIKIFIKENFSN